MPHGDRSRSPTDSTAINSGAAASTAADSIMVQSDMLQFPRPGATYPQDPILSPESQFGDLWKKNALQLIEGVKESITGPVEEICKNNAKSCAVGLEKRIDGVKEK